MSEEVKEWRYLKNTDQVTVMSSTHVFFSPLFFFFEIME